MNIGLSGGYFNYPLTEQTKYFQSMPEYLLLDGLTRLDHKVRTYGTKSYPVFNRHDIFHAHHFSRTFQFVSMFKRCPVCFTPHNPFIASGLKPELNRRNRYALKHSDALVVLSEREKQRYIQDYDVDETKIYVIPNGLKTKLYRKPNKLTSHLTYHIPNSNIVILFVGQSLPFKNVNLLFQAFKNLNVIENLTLIIKTPSRSNPVTMTYGKNIMEISSILTQQELTDLYWSCDIYVHPSNAEALSTVITEAMLCQRPIIATDVGGTSTQIINGKTGFLIEPNNLELLTFGLSHLITNPQLRCKLGRNAQEHAMKLFNQTRMIQNHVNLYNAKSD